MKKDRFLYITDYLVIIFSAVFAVLSFLNIGKESVQLMGMTFDRALLSGTGFLLLIPGVFLLAGLLNNRSSRILQWIRLFYIQGLYVVFFMEAIRISQMFYGGTSFDEFFVLLDYRIFGFHPSKHFYKLFSGYPLINEVIFISYFSFYLILSAGWWVLFFKGKKEEAIYCLFIVSAAFLLLDFFYCFFPVMGPKFYFPGLNSDYTVNFTGYFFTSTMTSSLSQMNLAGAAFPSSHVIIASIATALNLKYNRVLGILFIPVTLILYMSTVYIYAHYAVDVLAGLLFAFPLYRALRKSYPVLSDFTGSLKPEPGQNQLFQKIEN